MLKNSTLIVLGAGAHVPYYLPTTAELLVRIRESFPNYIDDLKRKPQQQNYPSDEVIKNFIEQTRDMGFLTIDRWIASNKGFEKIAKAAIAYILCNSLKHISSNLLGVQEMFSYYKNHNRGGDWISVFFNHLLHGIIETDDLNKLLHLNIKLVTFNYEHFFEYVFALRLNSSFSELKYSENRKILRGELLSKFFPIHINGSLRINTDISLLSRNSSMYTYSTYSELEAMADSIYTLGAEIEVENKINPYDYEQIFFLGFGYDDENLKRLGFSHSAQLYRGKIYGTAYGFSDLEISDVKERLSRLIGEKKTKENKIIIENKDSYQFLRERLRLKP